MQNESFLGSSPWVRVSPPLALLKCVLMSSDLSLAPSQAPSTATFPPTETSIDLALIFTPLHVLKGHAPFLTLMSPAVTQHLADSTHFVNIR